LTVRPLNPSLYRDFEASHPCGYAEAAPQGELTNTTHFAAEGGLLKVPRRRVTSKSGRLTVPAVFFPPDFAKEKCSVTEYRKWVLGHSKNLFLRDSKAKRPFACPGQKSVYRHKIDDAAHHGQFDPYTGEELQWELIDEWDPNLARGNRAYARKFALLPTVDHIDPESDILEFEICSWKINTCKGNLNPQEFVDLCKKVIQNRKVDG
jgi:hypothetical protein